MSIISVGSSGVVLFADGLVGLIVYLLLAIHHGPVDNRLVQWRLGRQIVFRIMLLDGAILRIFLGTLVLFIGF